jgi:hypothetical protein
MFSIGSSTWDVHTTGDRYWVITNPTNLYSQQLFPSMDYTLSFHVGVTARMVARRGVFVIVASARLTCRASRRDA